MYLIWNIYIREQKLSISRERLWILRTTLYPVALVPVWFSFAVGITRITDFKHHPSDVLVGFLIGFFYSTLVFGRTMLHAYGLLKD